MNKPYRNFDLPKQHLDERHYMPARARSKSEIERRRSLPSGTTLAEQQRDGLVIASKMLEWVEQPEDVTFTSNVIAMSGLNAGWYSYAAKSAVMRRRLSLPRLADEETGWRETHDGLLTKAQQGLAYAASLADLLVGATIEQRATEHYRQQIGRNLGNLSLNLACIELGNVAQSYSEFDIQDLAREHSLQMLDSARTFGDQIGTHPSIAQLADPNSDLAIHIRRHAPNDTLEAYEEALEVYPRNL